LSGNRRCNFDGTYSIDCNCGHCSLAQVCNPSDGTCAYTFCDNNLQLLVHLDENAATVIDSSDNGYSGAVNGTTYTASGQFAGAYDFDNVGDEINFGDVLDMGNDQDFTITG
jgi:hypothetical protein